jgi:hypothetical protein
VPGPAGQGLAGGRPELHLGGCPDDALGDIDRLGGVHGGGPQGAGLLLDLGGHGRLEHRQLDRPAALDRKAWPAGAGGPGWGRPGAALACGCGPGRPAPSHPAARPARASGWCRPGQRGARGWGSGAGPGPPPMVCRSRHCWRSSPRPSGDWAPKITGTPTSRRRSARWMAWSVPPSTAENSSNTSSTSSPTLGLRRVAKCPRSSRTRRTAASASVRLAMVGIDSTARSTSSRPQRPSAVPWRARKKAE